MIRLAIALGLAAGLCFPHSLNAQGSAPPTQALYQVTISGTASGRPFTRTAVLGISPTVDVVNASRTGINPREFSLQSGNPMFRQEPGAIQFATNVGVLTARSKLDVANVGIDPRTGTAAIGIAPNIALGSSFVFFTVMNGIAADIYSVTGGTITLQFANGWRNVNGTVNVKGRGFISGGAGSISARISGVRVR